MIEIVDEKSEQYIKILTDDGNEIDIIKKVRDLIKNNNCSKSIKVEYRKKVFDFFCNKKEKVTEDMVDLIEVAIEKCSVENKKLDINFIKILIIFYEKCKNYSSALKWIDYCPFEILNKEKFGKSRYSDYNLFYLKKAKYLNFLNDKSKLLELEEQYNRGGILDEEVIYFIRYHLCKLCFYNKDYENANVIFNELILLRRDQYLLILPIKYNDKKNIANIYFIMLELLIVYNSYLDLYIYDSILEFIKDYGEKELYDKLIRFVKIEKNKVYSCEKQKFNKMLYEFILKNDKILSDIYTGVLCNITRSGNGFIKSASFKENLFIKKSLIRSLKENDNIKFFHYDSKDKNGIIRKNAIILGGQFYE